MESTYQIALRYARKGFKVIPVAKLEKKPILADWVNGASSDASLIQQWFEDSDINIGIVTGKTSGIVVIDLDTAEDGDGMHSLAEMETKMGSFLPDTVMSKTQSGGIHLWFKYPSGVENIRGKVAILPHVDIRADGNQVVVYPSIGVKGEYEWIRAPWEHAMATLPKAWKQFICGEFSIDGMARIRIPKKAFALPDIIPAGVRHSKLLSYASSIAVRKKVTPTELAGAVREANNTRCNPPITNEDELNKIIEWAIDKIGKETVKIDESVPEWVYVSEKGKYIIDDGTFCKAYKDSLEIVCINGIFYNVEGVVDSNYIRQDIQNMIQNYVPTSLSAKVNGLFEGLRNECYLPQPEPVSNVVHTKECSLKVDETGVYEIDTGFTLNRLTVGYNLTAKAPIWKSFLSSLLEQEDILTLQEFIGYCLVPTTHAQKALFIIGRGGEGKSVIGDVIHSLFSNSMVQGELHHLQDNRFMLAQLENKLVFYDDDLQTASLSDTGTFKKLVTASIPLLVERKGEPHYEMKPYARIIASGNKGIEACYDHSDGFYRRLIVLRCKPKETDRKDDRVLAEKIAERELEGILNWGLQGLQRLMGNNWVFTLSEGAQANLAQAEEESNNIVSFLSDDTVLMYDKTVDASSSELYDTYCKWCDDNALKPLATRTFSTYLRENGIRWGAVYDNHVVRGSRNLRGFKGIGILERRKVEKVGRFKIVAGGSK